jgi:hypothetical protein
MLFIPVAVEGVVFAAMMAPGSRHVPYIYFIDFIALAVAATFTCVIAVFFFQIFIGDCESIGLPKGMRGTANVSENEVFTVCGFAHSFAIIAVRRDESVVAVRFDLEKARAFKAEGFVPIVSAAFDITLTLERVVQGLSRGSSAIDAAIDLLFRPAQSTRNGFASCVREKGNSQITRAIDADGMHLRFEIVSRMAQARGGTPAAIHGVIRVHFFDHVR